MKVTDRVGVLRALTVVVATGCSPQLQPPERENLSVIVQSAHRVARPRTKTLIGEFQARIQSTMSFRTNGRIDSRSAELGDRGSVGDELARLDSSQQKSDLDAADAALRSAMAVFDERLSNYTRLKSLSASAAASKQEVDEAETGMLSSRARVAIAEQRLEMAETRLTYTTLRATVSGVVVARYAEAGQVVDIGSPVFAVAVDGDRDVVFDTFPTSMSDIPEERRIELTLQSDPSVKAVGFIREISPKIDDANGTVRVKVSVVDPPEKMTLGAAVIGVANFPPKLQVSLPWTALVREANSPAVWIVDSESHVVEARTVKVDSFATGEILVSDGLVDGELIVTRGAQLIRPGQIVNPIKRESSL